MNWIHPAPPNAQRDQSIPRATPPQELGLENSSERSPVCGSRPNRRFELGARAVRRGGEGGEGFQTGYDAGAQWHSIGVWMGCSWCRSMRKWTPQQWNLVRGRGRKYYILTHRVPEAVLTSFVFWGIFLLLIPVFYERRITPNTAYLASGDFWALTLSAAEPKEVIDLGN